MPSAAGSRPAELPAKFWNDATGEVRVNELARSYAELERELGRSQRRLGEARRAEALSPQPAAAPAEAASPAPNRPDSALPPAPAADSAPDAEADAADAEAADPGAPDPAADAVPDSPEAYAVKLSHAWLARDPGVDAYLHAARFTQAQAQLVYDLAAERVIPAVQKMAAEYERRLAQQRLEAHFGGAEAYAAMAPQVAAWGRKHLPERLYAQLSGDPDGIVALHHMMRSGEPKFLAPSPGAAGAAPSLDRLRALADDPRYWRDHDPKLVAEVEAGFRRLYPGAGAVAGILPEA
jgi:hypothetical protein